MPAVSFSGLASGIDGDSIIKALLDARRLASLPLENKVERNKIESTALEEFNTRLLTLNDTVKDFRTVAGGAVSKTAASSNSDALAVVASADAVKGTTTLEIEQLAKSSTISFADAFEGPNAAIAPGLTEPGSFKVTVGAGENEQSFSIEIDSETTLSSLVLQINEQLPDSVQASYLNAGTASAPEYRFLLQGSKTGTELGVMSVDVSPELAAEGVFQDSTKVEAQNAILNIAGIGQVSRETNQISDLLPGISLDLKQAGVGPITINVNSDPGKTAKKLTEMVTALNDIISFSNESDKVERIENEGSVSNVFGPLARTRVDDQAIDSIKSALSAARADGDSSEIRVFADLGIKTKQDGTLEFDQSVFLTAVAKDDRAVNNLLQDFSDALGTANGIISTYTTFDGIIKQAVKSNDTENEGISDRLERLQRSLDRQQETMQKIFANLERTVGRLNSEGAAISSIISGFSRN